ncbi:MAG: hypothetical protein AAB337_02680 [Patescibacteria group bacterium]
MQSRLRLNVICLLVALLVNGLFVFGWPKYVTASAMDENMMEHSAPMSEQQTGCKKKGCTAPRDMCEVRCLRLPSSKMTSAIMTSSGTGQSMALQTPIWTFGQSLLTEIFGSTSINAPTAHAFLRSVIKRE